jgi:general secretion pathway protein I
MTVMCCLLPLIDPIFKSFRRAPRNQRGFSLLEALVAMAIASIALASLYRSVGQGSKNVVDVEARVEASLVARSAVAAGTFAEDLMRQDSGQAGEWHWRIQVAPEPVQMMDESGRPVAGPPLRAARVTVEVSKDGVTAVTWTTWKPYRSAP